MQAARKPHLTRSTATAALGIFPRHRVPSNPKAVRTRPLATGRRMHTTGATAARGPRRGTAQPRACAPALEFFSDQILHFRVVERQLGIYPLELGVFGLELLDPSQLGRLQAAVLALPLVVRRCANADLTAKIFDGHACVALFERRDDLRLGELRYAHGTSWLGNDARKIYLCGVYRSGELTVTSNFLGHTITLGVRDYGNMASENNSATGSASSRPRHRY